MAYVRCFLGALALQIIAAITAFCLSGNLPRVFTAEDFLIENLSALFFLASGVFGCWCLWRYHSHPWTFLLIVLLGFVGFLDEISFGQRWIGFTVPQIAGVEIDGVHDIVKIPLRPLRLWLKASPFAIAWMVAITSTIAVMLLLLALRYREKLQAGMRQVITRPNAAAWSVFVGLLASAVLIDERLIRFNVLAILEELLEMNAALALMLVAFCTIEQYKLSSPSAHAQRQHWGDA